MAKKDAADSKKSAEATAEGEGTESRLAEDSNDIGLEPDHDHVARLCTTLEPLYNLSLFVCTLVAVVARFWMIHHPDEVVFDEVHFGKFASYYLRGEYYFDVHPPLAKLVLALVGHCVGYDGHFLFEKIGDSYTQNNVPYIAFRIWCATCGAAVVPVAFLIMKELGVSVIGCTLGALLLAFDNALVTQSRLILLDSMLWLFCILAIYFWIRFRKLRHKSFSFAWWFWLATTGLGLAIVLGIKLVGLFTVASIGIATIVDLWELADIKRGLSFRQVTRHFVARAVCLIILPIVLYIAPFYLHFKLLPKSGPGDAFMSLGFQDTLIGNINTMGSVDLQYLSNVSMKHTDSGAYIHSHVHKIPLRHADNRISSNGQQVNAYLHCDNNSEWRIEPVDMSRLPIPSDSSQLYEQVPLTPLEEERGIRYVRYMDLVRLRHITTDSYLKTHDVASPLTQTHMEVTTIAPDDAKIELNYLETVWKIQGPANDRVPVQTKKGGVVLINYKHNVVLHTNRKIVLPAWGYKMQELNGKKEHSGPGIHWTFNDLSLNRSIDAINVKEPAKRHWLIKFVELQDLMISHNAALTGSHPYSSHAISWPFMLRGISFWEKKDGLKQIYMLGHPTTWILAILSIFVYAAVTLVDRLLLRRGVDDCGPSVRRLYDRSIGFLMIAWMLHWFPFFLMGRLLFLHHYLPAFIISVILLTTLIDYSARTLANNTTLNSSADVRFMRLLGNQGGLVYHLLVCTLILVTVYVFFWFMPLTYGLGFESLVELRRRKWIPTWDIQYA